MKTEKIVLSFIATLLGLLVAGVSFYFFSTKNTPSSQTKTVSIISPTPTPIPSILLTLNQPKDEDVVTDETITVSGQTKGDTIIVILINGVETVITPSLSGKFSTQRTLSNGQNIIEVISIAKDGESKSIKKTVTYSQEKF